MFQYYENGRSNAEPIPAFNGILFRNVSPVGFPALPGI
jgi:hypothetical protein